MDATRKQIYRFLTPAKGCAGEFGVWMAVLDETRRTTLEAMSGLTAAQLAWKPPHGGNSIGQLLRHIAGVELEWIHEDLLGGRPYPPALPEVLSGTAPMADPGPLPLSDFVKALEFVRKATRKALEGMKAAEIEASRTTKAEGGSHVFTVRWILFHIADHESQHRGQILAVRRMMNRASTS